MNGNINDTQIIHAEDRIFGRRPYGFGIGRPFGYGYPYGFGGPFLGGVVGGLLGSALFPPYGYGYGYPYPYPVPFYGGYGYPYYY